MKRLWLRFVELAAAYPRRFIFGFCGAAVLGLLIVALAVALHGGTVAQHSNKQSGNGSASSSGSGSNSGGSGSSGSNSGFPYVSGANMYTADGKVLRLRGAMVETSFAYIKNYIDKKENPLDDLNDATFKAMQSWGMDAVRINISQWIQQADTTNQYLSRLDTAITSANNHGLYVILDFHNDGQSGAVSPYADEMLHKTSETWWVSIAQRYKSNAMVLFDLINEPKYTSVQSWEHGDGGDVVGVPDVVQAIRAAGVQNIIVLEPGAAGGSQLKGWQSFTTAAITDKNSIVSKHDYSEVPGGYFSGDSKAYWEKDWGPFVGNRPLFYGEWAVLPHPNYPSFCKGVTSSNADAVTNAFLNFMQTEGASWTAWSFTPTHMIDSWTSLQPTSMQTGAPWSCQVTSGPAMNAGMGLDVKNFLQANP